MKVIIAGSRDLKYFEIISGCMNELDIDHHITEVVSGKAKGVDTHGEMYAQELGVPVKPFPAKWKDLKTQPVAIGINRSGEKYNKLAGFNRNQQMADYADACIIIRHEKSNGSLDMLRRAQEAGMPWCDIIIADDGIDIVRGTTSDNWRWPTASAKRG